MSDDETSQIWGRKLSSHMFHVSWVENYASHMFHVNWIENYASYVFHVAYSSFGQQHCYWLLHFLWSHQNADKK